jgi:hypothetical protein
LAKARTKADWFDYVQPPIFVGVAGFMWWYYLRGPRPAKHKALLDEGFEYLGLESGRVKYLEELYRIQGEETTSAVDRRGRVHWYVRRGYV